MADRTTGTDHARGHSARRLVGIVMLTVVLMACTAEDDASAPAPSRAVMANPSQDGGTEPAPSPPPAPSTVTIPSIDLDEKLVSLGLRTDGSLEVPNNPDRAGWFSGGGRPGGAGPTVIAGHVDSRTGPAVFARLTELRPGDRVMLDDAQGTRTTYRVDAARDVPRDAFPTVQVFGSTPDDQLRLITCTGDFDRQRGGYQQNRLVFASPVG